MLTHRASRASVVVGFACVTIALGAARDARAEPLRLRGDALVEARAPTGLIVLQGEDKERPAFGAEALVWAGARTDPTADILVLTFRLRDPHGVGELRGGRFVFTTGAIRPVQIDGASGRVRTPWVGTFEAVVGSPVVPRFGARPHEWLAGARAAQAIGARATVGASYVQRRDRGEISDDELGVDLAAAPADRVDLAARGAYDVTSPGLADALLSAALRLDAWRFEVFGRHRSPSRLLPATSLFSVLGDFPSEDLGTTLLWRAAPRLDVRASAVGQVVGAELGGNAWMRALLRLDDRGDGTLGLELRRQHVSTARWTGARGIASQELGRGFRFSTELELAFPDEPRGRGGVWPWGLMALGWRSRSGWEAAAAVEGASSPEHRYETDALLRLSYAWASPGAPR